MITFEDNIDRELFEALHIDPADLPAFMEKCEELDKFDKVTIILFSDAGHKFDIFDDSVNKIDISIHQLDSFYELAQELVDEGCFGEIPDEPLSRYIDYDAIGRDLSFDYAKTEVDGETYIYSCY